MNRPAAERRERRQNRRHLIMDVRYALMAEQGRPMSEAPILCSCGEVTTSGGWEAHRGLTLDQERVARSHAAYLERQATA